MLLTISALPIVPPLNCCCRAAIAVQLRLPAPSVVITKLVEPPVILTLLIEPSDVMPLIVALLLTTRLPVTEVLPVVSICTLVCPPVFNVSGRNVPVPVLFDSMSTEVDDTPIAANPLLFASLELNAANELVFPVPFGNAATLVVLLAVLVWNITLLDIVALLKSPIILAPVAATFMILPPTLRLSPIPAPPATINAPVDVLILVVLLLIFNAPVIVPPLKPLGNDPTDTQLNVPLPFVVNTNPLVPPVMRTVDTSPRLD